MIEYRTHCNDRIYILDAYPVVAYGVAQLLLNSLKFDICGTSNNVTESINNINAMRPDLLIFAPEVSASASFEPIRLIKHIQPEIRILTYSVLDEQVYAERALKAGSNGYLMKCAPIENLLKAVQEILKGNTYTSPRIAQGILARLSAGSQMHSGMDLLSDRELEVLQLLGGGCSTREISSKLSLSVKTIERHRENIKRKVKLSNATQLIKFATLYVERTRHTPLRTKSI